MFWLGVLTGAILYFSIGLIVVVIEKKKKEKKERSN